MRLLATNGRGYLVEEDLEVLVQVRFKKRSEVLTVITNLMPFRMW